MNEGLRVQKILQTISDFHAMDNPASGFARTLGALTEVFPGCVIVGGIALSCYVNNPRATKDVNIALLGDFETGGDPQGWFEKVPEKPYTVRHKETSIEVDILSKNHPLVNLGLLEMLPGNTNQIEQARTTLRVAKPEILVGLKLARAVHNTPEGLQDRADILALLRDNPDLDLGAIRPHLSTEENDRLEDLIGFGKNLLRKQ